MKHLDIFWYMEMWAQEHLLLEDREDWGHPKQCETCRTGRLPEWAERIGA